METVHIVSIIVGAILVFYIAATIYKHFKLKKLEETSDKFNGEYYEPMANGYTQSLKDDHYNPKTRQFSIVLDEGHGPSMTWAHEDMNAFDSLSLAFEQDRMAGVEIFDDSTQERMLNLAHQYDKHGWPYFGHPAHTPVPGKVNAESIASAFENLRGMDDGRMAYAPDPSYQKDEDVKLSSCCRVRLFNLTHNGAHKCPKCNKFCKAI